MERKGRSFGDSVDPVQGHVVGSEHHLNQVPLVSVPRGQGTPRAISL